MAQPKTAVWGFLLIGVLFVVVALIPLMRGGSLNATFLAVSVVFFHTWRRRRKEEPRERLPASRRLRRNCS